MLIRIRTVLPALLAVLYATPWTAGGQELVIGVKGGMVRSGFTNMPGWVSRTGATAGAALSTTIHPFAALQVDLLITSAGADFPGTPEDVQLYRPAEQVSFTYLQIPLLARLRLNSVVAAPVRPTLMAGPAVSVLLGCRYAREGPDTWSPAPEGVPVSCRSRNPRSRANGGAYPAIGVHFSDPRTLDAALLAGAGLEISLGATSLSIETRYSQSLLEFDRIPGGARHRGWSVLLGWSRTLGQVRRRRARA
jgi:hypothetical protein